MSIFPISAASSWMPGKVLVLPLGGGLGEARIKGGSLYFTSPFVKRGYRLDVLSVGVGDTDREGEGGECDMGRGTLLRGTIGRMALFIYSTGEIVAAGGGPRDARI